MLIALYMLTKHSMIAAVGHFIRVKRILASNKCSVADFVVKA